MTHSAENADYTPADPEDDGIGAVDGDFDGTLFLDPDVAAETRPCGCPEDYHLADCPLRYPGSDE